MATAKRHDQADAVAELKAWRMAFKSGYDYLRDLRKIGVPDGDRHQPPRDLMEDEWRWLGRAFLDARGPEANPTWAERALGQPEDMAAPAKARRRR